MYIEARGLWLSRYFAQPLHQLLLDIACEVVLGAKEDNATL
jgi:hypothetical protein